MLIIAQAGGLISVCLMLLYSAPLSSILPAGIVPNQIGVFCILVLPGVLLSPRCPLKNDPNEEGLTGFSTI